MQPSQALTHLRSFCLIAGGCALIAAFDMPYNYYRLTRWLVFIVAALYGTLQLRGGQAIRAYAYLGLALVFNPLLPLHFPKNVWRVVDVAACIMLVFAPRICQAK
jgi:hypothetical protein